MTTSEDSASLPKHVAIIMDGNNRFAKKNQMQKGEGHRSGKDVLDPIVEHCRKKHIQALTVFAFSSENWNRPQFEVDLLMQLLETTIHEQLPRMEKFNIALRFIGDRSRLSPHLRELMLHAEQRTANFNSMTLTIAISYGGMWDMAQAAKQIAADVVAHKIDIEQIDTQLFGQYVSLADLPPVDLLIRTGGDFRLSNFLLWQAAYAELYFTQTLWPEFSIEEFDDALAVFGGRERRFGKTSEQIQQEKIEN
ncbi:MULTISPECIES: polyprenyl diphosphate synthase [Acinetobacter]|jgi:undecaprenyl diphosphate synthase|uniref:Ditrans,polycis-undecaprenyl-diphosphate synthase ((2E,6E)-farnesyl-diphosphate specific) n=1 Tax=Acinetobacter towneri TaxID=202956 RepID=A0AAP4M3J8_9GAMM|nr:MULTISPECIES: polyprenyl diphosphate synthase [Acinetobacter]GIT83930.1 ditrans,polycis-undecaprenyl-diphosphate synthase [Acinetobacter seohaensis]AVH48472.1 di-trans,poly-cis-decaprenylcistransferase [Acinetobacter sp. SWBY1]ENV68551.1 undecaprenyl pyrophosphate synthase [Acinetobacter towneri DSM 14962 = CIP 107472]MCA4778945.1 di-trans,poly-cis-decaprenylcistransferase [Acinetobacter towneri]MCA4784192.1 di-trans,poly-cis-decaprenylcistransferase [Acinetobacter towneri]